MKYKVSVRVTKNLTVFVEADSKEEAIENAIAPIDIEYNGTDVEFYDAQQVGYENE